MKIRKRLLTPTGSLPLVSEDVRLELSAPGRAVFQVATSEPVSGEVLFTMGYGVDDADTLFFAGFVERYLPVDDTQARLMCREMSARMDKAIPLALRHPTLRDVLTEYANATGLRFLFPERPYMDTKIPAFNMLGTGLEGLANIGGAFQISDYIWQATGDGSVWLGSWEDSRWPSRPVELPRNVFRNVPADGGKSCPPMPAMRPGVVLNGERVTLVHLSGHQMTLKTREAA